MTTRFSRTRGMMRLAALALAGATMAGAIPVTRLAAQRPGAERGRFEVPGLDWAPGSAWRTRAGAVRANRLAALRRGDLAALNQRPGLLKALGPGGTSAFAVTGAFFVPVIAIAYGNVDAAFPKASFQGVLFAATHPEGAAYTLKGYYEQVSNGRITMNGLVFDPVRVDSTNSYYENGCNGIGVLNTCPDNGRRFGLMLNAVLDSISNSSARDTVWSRFDNDGPDGLPNSGDDDGDVDFVTFIQPTVDGACGAPGIWAHRWVMSAWNNGSKYVTKTPRTGRPGEFLRVENYTIQSQVGGPSGCTPGLIMPVGTVAHETGHAFGLPDLYDTDRAGSGTEGIGEWGIMGSGNYSRPYSPAGYDPWSLMELGWVTLDTLGSTRVVTTGARQTSDTVFVARTRNPAELILIENRQAVESDSTMLNPLGGSTSPTCRSNCRKVPGLLLWHIDQDRIASGIGLNRINTGPIQGVAVIQADGLNQLRQSGTGRNRGDQGDPFPGSAGRTRWGLTTNPAARTNGGDYVGFVIDSIAELPAGVVRFRYLKRQPSVVASAVPGARVRVNGESWGRFEDVIAAGESIALDADSLQEVQGGRTRARFLSWSIGGPRTRSITSGATPDTITAAFAAEHRVLVTLTGGGLGAVTASTPGELGTGVFLPQGAPVTLTATPQPGTVFVGWRGDTTAATAAITLPMGRPYDLEASFLLSIAVSVADATTDLLGTAVLSIDQRLYLDALGNRNGLYDVGDYLALLRRSGQPVPAAVLARLGARRPKGDD